MSRRVAVNLIAFVGVFVLVLWWAVNNIVSFDAIERPYRIRGRFEATAGVAEGSEVAYLGVRYGSVRGIEVDDGAVAISMAMDRDKKLPAGATAHIQRKSAVGEPYIDFRPPERRPSGRRWIEAGETIPLSRTTVPLEFSEILRSASRVIGAVDPERTSTLVHELALALDGRSDDLRGLVVDSDALLRTFADRSELLDRLTDSSTRLVATVTSRREALSSSVEDLAALAESLRRVDPQANVLLERGSRLLDTTADVVSDTKGPLDCILGDLGNAIGVAAEGSNLASLVTLLEVGPEGLGVLGRVRDTEPGGVWTRVALLVNGSNPAPVYAEPRVPPAVPQVPPCASALASAAPADEPGAGASGGADAGRTPPPTGGDRSRADDDGAGDGEERAVDLGDSERSADGGDDGRGAGPAALAVLAALVAAGAVVLAVRRWSAR